MKKAYGFSLVLLLVILGFLTACTTTPTQSSQDQVLSDVTDDTKATAVDSTLDEIDMVLDESDDLLSDDFDAELDEMDALLDLLE